MTVRIQFRRGLASQWSSSNPILASGELGYSTDDQVIKIGDGSKTWSQLNAFAAGDISVIKASSGLTFGPETTGYGTSSAGTTSSVELQIATGGVTTSHLANSLVTTEKIANDAVTAAKIASGAVAASELASSAVETAKINDSAVTTAKINDSAVTTAKINDSAVTNAKLGLTEVKLRRVAAQSYSSTGGSYQPDYISWDTEDADVSGFISATSDTLTVPAGLGGLYLWNYRFTVDLTSGGAASCRGNHLLVNGDQISMIEDVAYSNGPAALGQSAGSLYLAAGDTLKVGIRVDLETYTSSSADITAAFWMTRIMD